MKVIEARNVHQALPKGLALIESAGVRKSSRNGDVFVVPSPVTTVYTHPTERLTFWESRDVNVAFLVAEALWMIAGRNDLGLLTRYIKDFGRYSDDGRTLRGAYGYRWRQQVFGGDQLTVIARMLKENPDERRAMLQMWDATLDLGWGGKDVPCNTMVAFQRYATGALDMTVFCRSNDIIWGAYFANAFHLSLLQEYLAAWIGCPVGTYTQVSVNWHAYVGPFTDVRGVIDEGLGRLYGRPEPVPDPYVRGEVEATLISVGADAVEEFDRQSAELLTHVSSGFGLPRASGDGDPFFDAAWAVLRAHELWRTLAAPERFTQAMAALATAPPKSDLVVGMRRWIVSRARNWEQKMEAK